MRAEKQWTWKQNLKGEQWFSNLQYPVITVKHLTMSDNTPCWHSNLFQFEDNRENNRKKLQENKLKLESGLI